MPISIVTPVYNRANIINKLFRSLLAQDNYDFEWIVIDDGSTDNIKEVIKKLQISTPFPIRFLHKENGGKHSALNKGVVEAGFDWIYIVDSDDLLPTNAISVISNDIKSASDSHYAGIVYLKAFATSEKIVGDLFDTSTINYKNFSTVKGDKALVLKKHLLINNPFPIFDNEKFITEAYCWNKILDEYYLLAKNQVVYFCEYLENGLTFNYSKLLQENKQGTLSFVKSNLSLKNLNLGIYKQTIFHFFPIMNADNLRIVKECVSFHRYYIFKFLLMIFLFKKKIKRY